MTEYELVYKVESAFKNITKSHGIDCKLKISRTHAAYYNKNENIMYYHPEKLLRRSKQLNMNFDKFIEFTTYHEIGHYIDNKKGTWINDIVQMEMNAWNYSRKLVSEDELLEYDKFNMISLNAHIETLEKKKLKVK